MIHEAQLPLTNYCLRSLFPRGQILRLLRGEGIDLHAHSLELQAGNFFIDFRGDGVYLLLEFVRVLRHVLSGKRLIRERHIHHGSRMPFSGSEVDEPPFAKDVDLASIFCLILIYEWAHTIWLAVAHLLQRDRKSTRL